VIKSFVLVVSTTYILYCMGYLLKGHESSTRNFGVGWVSTELVSVEIYRLFWNSLVDIVGRLQALLSMV
jgi:hypothetical protein